MSPDESITLGSKDTSYNSISQLLKCDEDLCEDPATAPFVQFDIPKENGSWKKLYNSNDWSTYENHIEPSIFGATSIVEPKVVTVSSKKGRKQEKRVRNKRSNQFTPPSAKGAKLNDPSLNDPSLATERDDISKVLFRDANGAKLNDPSLAKERDDISKVLFRDATVIKPFPGTVWIIEGKTYKPEGAMDAKEDDLPPPLSPPLCRRDDDTDSDDSSAFKYVHPKKPVAAANQNSIEELSDSNSDSEIERESIRKEMMNHRLQYSHKLWK